MTKIATQPRIHFTSLRLMAFRDTFDFSDNQFFFGSKLHQNWNVIAYLKEEVSTYIRGLTSLLVRLWMSNCILLIVQISVQLSRNRLSSLHSAHCDSSPAMRSGANLKIGPAKFQCLPIFRVGLTL